MDRPAAARWSEGHELVPVYSSTVLVRHGTSSAHDTLSPQRPSLFIQCRRLPPRGKRSAAQLPRASLQSQPVCHHLRSQQCSVQLWGSLRDALEVSGHSIPLLNDAPSLLHRTAAFHATQGRWQGSEAQGNAVLQHSVTRAWAAEFVFLA